MESAEPSQRLEPAAVRRLLRGYAAAAAVEREERRQSGTVERERTLAWAWIEDLGLLGRVDRLPSGEREENSVRAIWNTLRSRLGS